MIRLIVFISLFFAFSSYGQEIKLSLPLGHKSMVVSASFSNNGKLLVTASTDETAKVFDVSTGALIHSLSGHNSPLYSANFSKDDKYIVTTTMDGEIKVFETLTGKFIRNIYGHNWSVFDIDFSPDGKHFVTASEDGTAKIIDFNSGEIVYKLKAGKMEIASAKYSPDGTAVLTISNDQQVRIFETETGKQKQVFGELGMGYNSASFNNNGKYIVTTSYDGKARVFDCFNGELVKTLEGHPSNTYSAEFSPDGRYVSTVSENNAYLFEFESGNLIHTLKGHTMGVKKAHFSQGGKFIVTISFDKKANIYDVLSGELLFVLDGESDFISSAVFSPDGNFINITYEGKASKLFDIRTGKVRKSFEGKSFEVNTANFSPDGRYVIAASDDKSVRVLELATGKLYRSFKGMEFNSNTAEFSPNGEHVLLTSLNKALIYELNSGKLVKELLGSTSDYVYANYSANGDYIEITSWAGASIFYPNPTPISNWDNISRGVGTSNHISKDEQYVAVDDSKVIKVYDLYSQKLVSSFSMEDEFINHFEFDDGNKLIISTSNLVQVVDYKSGEHLFKITSKKGQFRKAFFDNSNDRFIVTEYGGTTHVYSDLTGKTLSKFSIESSVDELFTNNDTTILVASLNGGVGVFNIENGEEICSYNIHSDEILSIDFFEDEQLILTGSKDGSFALYDLENRRIVNRHFFFDEDDHKHIVLNGEGYYSGNKEMLNLLFYTQGLKVFPFSQFDLKFNRPDQVLSSYKKASQVKIESYKNAYNKRLKKIGFTEGMLDTDFHLPEISIRQKEEIPYQMDKNELTINLTAKDSKKVLDRINVWINNVPIYGVNGISLRDKNTQNYKTEIDLQLNEGDNKIEVSVLNQSGAESYKETVYINCTKPAPKPNLYFVGIGVKNYVNEDMNLKYSDKDIRDVASLYGSSKAYGKVYIDTFLNVSATKNILPQIRQRLESTTIHDQVIFMYSGHGVLDDSLDYYLTTHDIDFLNPSTKGIPYEAVDELLDNIPARQKLVLIDACNSGEVDKDELEVDNTTGITAEVIAPKGDMFKKYTTKTNSFEMMQELFTDLRRGTGATVISSSSGKYFSFEDKKYQNGVYTYALKLGLEGAADTNEDNEITVSELKEFLYTKVESLTNGKQKPTARQENLEYDFRVW